MHPTPPAVPTAHPSAGLTLTLAIGQRVRHCSDYKGRRVTGVLRCISIDDGVLMATVGLDEPLVIPPLAGFGETRIHTQHVPAHELVPYDARDELMAEMAAALEGVIRVADRATVEFDAARDALAKFKGGAV